MKRVYLSLLSISLLLFKVINCSQQSYLQPGAPASAAPTNQQALNVKQSAENKTKKDKRPHRALRTLWDYVTVTLQGANVKLQEELEKINADEEYFSSGSQADDGAFITQAMEQFEKAKDYNAIARLIPMLIRTKAPVTDFARRTQRKMIRRKRDELAQTGAITLINRVGCIQFEHSQAQQKAEKILADAKAQADKVKTEAKIKLEQDLRKAQAAFSEEYDTPLKVSKRLLKQTYAYEDSNSDYEEDEPTFADISQLNAEQLQALKKEQVLTTQKVKRKRKPSLAQDEVEGS